MSGLITLPWCLKPIFGYFFDILARKLKSRKLVVLLCGFIRIFCNYFLSCSNPEVKTFYCFLVLISLCELFENITCECILVLQSKEDNINSSFD